MPDNQPDSLSPQTEAQVDVFQLLETLWREKLLIGLTILVFALGAMIYSGYAALTAPKAVTMYKVQMDIRPGITSYSDGFKAPVRGWTVDDIIAWINHRYYSPFLSNVDDVKATKGTAQTVTLSVLTLDPQKGQKMLNDLVSTWVRYYSDEGRDQNIAASQIALRNAIQTVEDQIRLSEKVSDKELDLQIEKCSRQIKAYQEELARINQQYDTNQKNAQRMKQKAGNVPSNSSSHPRTLDLLNSLKLDDSNPEQDPLSKSQKKEQPDMPLEAMAHYPQIQIWLTTQIENLTLKHDSLKLEKEETLPAKRRELQGHIQEYQLKLKALAPVEKVTEPIVSAVPPARSRLMLRLVLSIVAGAFMGILLAFLHAGWKTRKERQEKPTGLDQ